MSKTAILKTVIAFYAVALVILISAYSFPTRITSAWLYLTAKDLAIYAPVLLSILLLVPFYLWQRVYQKRVELSTLVNGKNKGMTLFWIFTLFTLAMSVRIPSVLLFAEPYEKTPLIFLLVMTVILVEKTEPSVLGFKTENFRKSLMYGATFFAVLGGMILLVYGLLVYVFTNQVIIQSYDFTPFLLAMPFMTLCVGISEEGLFRGYMQTHLEQFFSPKQAILAQAVLFGGWHFVWNLSPFDPWAMGQYVAETFLAGLLFGYFFSKTRNLMPLILAHGLWNSIPMGIVTSQSAINAMSAASPMIQILVSILPYGISALIAFVFIKRYAKKV